MVDTIKGSRCGRFITEFQEDILRVYGLPETTWISGQYLRENSHFEVRQWIDLKFKNGPFIEAMVEGPVFYCAMASDKDNVERFVEAMDARDGLEREEIVRRMRLIGLISKDLDPKDGAP